MSDVPAVPTAADVLVNPVTGELVLLTDAAACAHALEAIRETENRLREAKAELSRAVAEIASQRGTRTLEIGQGWRAVVSHPRQIEWDMEVLERLRDAGLPEDRWDALVAEEVTYKVSARVAEQIAGANPEYARIIDRARTDAERPPTVSIRRR